jgi:large-conductance mechanosensitive channel
MFNTFVRMMFCKEQEKCSISGGVDFYHMCREDGQEPAKYLHVQFAVLITSAYIILAWVIFLAVMCI